MEQKLKSNNNKGFAHLILLVVLVLILGGGAYYYLTVINPNILSNLPLPKKEAGLRQVDLQEEAKVMITKGGFNPATLTVKKGTQVTFVNDDADSHQIASDPYPTNTLNLSLNAPTSLKTKDTFSTILNKSGSFTYHDQLNPFKLKGTIIVVN